VLRQSGFYSETIDVERGCTQGDTDSPIIFNLIVDAVLRKWKSLAEFGKSRAYFYADNGLMENTNPDTLQKDLDAMIGLFKEMGLNTNETKTKYMILRGAAAPKALSLKIFNKIQKRGKRARLGTHSTWRRKKTECVRFVER